MESLVLPFFGETHIEPLLEIYQTTIKINDSDVILSLNFPDYSEYYGESIKEVKEKNEITDIIDVNLSEKENLICLKDNLLLRKINIYPKADDTDYIHFEYHLAEISSCTLNVYYDNQQHITGVNYSIPFTVFIKYME